MVFLRRGIDGLTLYCLKMRDFDFIVLDSVADAQYLLNRLLVYFETLILVFYFSESQQIWWTHLKMLSPGFRGLSSYIKDDGRPRWPLSYSFRFSFVTFAVLVDCYSTYSFSESCSPIETVQELNENAVIGFCFFFFTKYHVFFLNNNNNLL